MFAQFLRTLKVISMSSHAKLRVALFQATIYIFRFFKMQKGLYIKYFKIILVQGFCQLKTEIVRSPIGSRFRTK